MRIAVVTPLFPISSEPYRGQPIYNTVLPLTSMADVRAFYVAARYPPFLRPRAFQYKDADPSWQPPGVRTSYLTYPTLPVIGRGLNATSSLRAMLGPLREFHPDLILGYWAFPEGLGAVLAGAQLGIPTIIGSRGSDLLKIPDETSRAGVARALQGAAATVVVSEELRRKAISLGAHPEHVHTIVNGCDRSIFFPADRAEARLGLSIDLHARIILYVGHLIPGKGLRELVAAWRELRASDPSLQLILLGEGQMHSELAQLQQPGLLLPGAKPAREVARYLAACDLFTLPSHSEGCPNVVIEALACGRPVVGSTVGAIPDLLDDGCGFTVPSRDPAALQSALARALAAPWDPDVIAARHGRSWHDAALETFRVCQAAVGSRNAQSPSIPLH